MFKLPQGSNRSKGNFENDLDSDDLDENLHKFIQRKKMQPKDSRSMADLLS